MGENFPQEPSPEDVRREIEELKRVAYEGWAGENFDKLPPDLQEEFIDITWEAEYGRDLEVARSKLKVLIEKLKDL